MSATPVIDVVALGHPLVDVLTRETDDVVLVTEATCRLLTRDHGGFAERGEVALRGRSEPVKVRAALAAASAEVR